MPTSANRFQTLVRLLRDAVVTIDAVSLASLRQAIGLVSQDVYPFEGSSRDNIAYSKPDASEAEV